MKPVVGVVGLGLIGGSILKGLKKQGYKLIAVSRTETSIETAKGLNLADTYSTNMDCLKNADVVFVCAPISKTIETIEKVAEHTKPTAIIADVASLKGFIVDYFNDKSNIKFIGTHPMAGTEFKGIENSPEELYVEAKWVITPTQNTDKEDINTIKLIIEDIKAIPIIAEADEHDKAVSLISHFPLLVSQSLFGTVQNHSDKSVKNLAFKLAASGFRDTTRIAATNIELAKDMEIHNKKNVLESLENFKKYIDDIKNLLESNEEAFIDTISEIAEHRNKLYSKDGKNIFPIYPID